MFGRKSGAEAILKALSESRKINPDGSEALVGFFATDPWEEALTQILNLPNRTHAFRRELVRRVSKKRQSLSRETFLQDARIEIGIMDRESRQYEVVFRVIGDFQNLKPISLHGDAELRFFPKRSTPFHRKVIASRIERMKERGLEAFHKLQEQTPQGRLLSVRLKAFSARDAYEKAQAQFESYLGILAFIELNGWQGNLVDRTYSPLTRYQLLSPTTIHRPSGELECADMWIYDSQRWLFDYQTIQLQEKARENLKRNYRAVVRSIRSQSDTRKTSTLQSLQQFYRVVSTENHEERFIELWKLLEMIGISRGENESMIASRISGVWQEKSEVKSAVLAMQSLRNSITHRRSEGANAAFKSFASLFRFSMPLFQRAIMERSVSELSDLHSVLDMADGSEDLGKKISLTKIALARQKGRAARAATNEEAEQHFPILRTDGKSQ